MHLQQLAFIAYTPGEIELAHCSIGACLLPIAATFGQGVLPLRLPSAVPLVSEKADATIGDIEEDCTSRFSEVEVR